MQLSLVFIAAVISHVKIVPLNLNFISFKISKDFKVLTFNCIGGTLKARKALRALKGLVKLQALVQGHIVRKQIAERLLQMQAAFRARTRARALRAQIYESSQSAIKPCHIHYLGPATPKNSEHDIHRSRSSKHEQSVMLEKNGSISTFKVGPDKEKLNVRYSTDEGSHDRVYSRSHSFTTSKDSTYHQAIFSPSSGEDESLSPLKYKTDVDEASFCATETYRSLHEKVLVLREVDHLPQPGATSQKAAKAVTLTTT